MFRFLLIIIRSLFTIWRYIQYAHTLWDPIMYISDFINHNQASVYYMEIHSVCTYIMGSHNVYFGLYQPSSDLSLLYGDTFSVHIHYGSHNLYFGFYQPSSDLSLLYGDTFSVHIHYGIP